MHKMIVAQKPLGTNKLKSIFSHQLYRRREMKHLEDFRGLLKRRLQKEKLWVRLTFQSGSFDKVSARRRKTALEIMVIWTWWFPY